jgi:hypothetical protein
VFVVVLLSVLFSTLAAKLFTSKRFLIGAKWEEPLRKVDGNHKPAIAKQRPKPAKQKPQPAIQEPQP